MKTVEHDIKPGEIPNSTYIVLVEPENSINIGSVLRAASNFGFENIRIVKPLNFIEEQVRMTACWGDYLIEKIKFFDSLPEALGDLQTVVGFSSSIGSKRPDHVTLPEFIEKNNFTLKTGLLFGPEDTGLTIEHMAHCKYLVRIPTTAKNSSINLAQAALIALYELSRLSWTSTDTDANIYPDMNDFYQLERLIDSVGSEAGFFGSGTPQPIPDLLKNMFKRINPDKHEIGVLLGFIGKLDRTIKYLKGKNA